MGDCFDEAQTPGLAELARRWNPPRFHMEKACLGYGQTYLRERTTRVLSGGTRQPRYVTHIITVKAYRGPVNIFFSHLRGARFRKCAEM